MSELQCGRCQASLNCYRKQGEDDIFPTKIGNGQLLSIAISFCSCKDVRDCIPRTYITPAVRASRNNFSLYIPSECNIENKIEYYSGDYYWCSMKVKRIRFGTLVFKQVDLNADKITRADKEIRELCQYNPFQEYAERRRHKYTGYPFGEETPYSSCYKSKEAKETQKDKHYVIVESFEFLRTLYALEKKYKQLKKEKALECRRRSNIFPQLDEKGKSREPLDHPIAKQESQINLLQDTIRPTKKEDLKTDELSKPDSAEKAQKQADQAAPLSSIAKPMEKTAVDSIEPSGGTELSISPGGQGQDPHAMIQTRTAAQKATLSFASDTKEVRGLPHAQVAKTATYSKSGDEEKHGVQKHQKVMSETGQMVDGGRVLQRTTTVTGRSMQQGTTRSLARTTSFNERRMLGEEVQPIHHDGSAVPHGERHRKVMSESGHMVEGGRVLQRTTTVTGGIIQQGTTRSVARRGSLDERGMLREVRQPLHHDSPMPLGERHRKVMSETGQMVEGSRVLQRTTTVTGGSIQQGTTRSLARRGSFDERRMLHEERQPLHHGSTMPLRERHREVMSETGQVMEGGRVLQRTMTVTRGSIQQGTTRSVARRRSLDERGMLREVRQPLHHDSPMALGERHRKVISEKGQMVEGSRVLQRTATVTGRSMQQGTTRSLARTTSFNERRMLGEEVQPIHHDGSAVPHGERHRKVMSESGHMVEGGRVLQRTTTVTGGIIQQGTTRSVARRGSLDERGMLREVRQPLHHDYPMPLGERHRKAMSETGQVVEGSRFLQRTTTVTGGSIQQGTTRSLARRGSFDERRMLREERQPLHHGSLMPLREGHREVMSETGQMVEGSRVLQRATTIPGGHVQQSTTRSLARTTSFDERRMLREERELHQAPMSLGERHRKVMSETGQMVDSGRVIQRTTAVARGSIHQGTSRSLARATSLDERARLREEHQPLHHGSPMPLGERHRKLMSEARQTVDGRRVIQRTTTITRDTTQKGTNRALTKSASFGEREILPTERQPTHLSNTLAKSLSGEDLQKTKGLTQRSHAYTREQTEQERRKGLMRSPAVEEDALMPKVGTKSVRELGEERLRKTTTDGAQMLGGKRVLQRTTTITRRQIQGGRTHRLAGTTSFEGRTVHGVKKHGFERRLSMDNKRMIPTEDLASSRMLEKSPIKGQAMLESRRIQRITTMTKRQTEESRRRGLTRTTYVEEEQIVHKEGPYTPDEGRIPHKKDLHSPRKPHETKLAKTTTHGEQLLEKKRVMYSGARQHGFTRTTSMDDKKMLHAEDLASSRRLNKPISVEPEIIEGKQIHRTTKVTRGHTQERRDREYLRRTSTGKEIVPEDLLGIRKQGKGKLAQISADNRGASSSGRVNQKTTTITKVQTPEGVKRGLVRSATINEGAVLRKFNKLNEGIFAKSTGGIGNEDDMKGWQLVQRTNKGKTHRENSQNPSKQHDGNKHARAATGQVVAGRQLIPTTAAKAQIHQTKAKSVSRTLTGDEKDLEGKRVITRTITQKSVEKGKQVSQAEATGIEKKRFTYADAAKLGSMQDRHHLRSQSVGREHTRLETIKGAHVRSKSHDRNYAKTIVGDKDAPQELSKALRRPKKLEEKYSETIVGDEEPLD